LFEHGLFEVYEFENVPLDEDSYIIDEIYLEEYESAMLNRFSGGDYRNVGTIGWVIPQRRINNNSLELSWFPNPLDRYHIVTVSLPKDQIVKCVSCYEHSERPHLFVKSSWMNHLYLRHYSIFCLVDAIGFKKALNDNELTRVKLIALRDAIDKVAEMYSEVSFISFADNLLLKSNWTVGTYRDEVPYSYNPELFLEVVKNIKEIYKDILGLDIYAIITQGSNEYYGDTLLHISESKNHISLNSLGIPFAQLMEIDNAVSSALHSKDHSGSDLYMEQQFLYSLHFRSGFDKDQLEKYTYKNKMTGSDRNYYCIMWKQLLENLKPKSENDQ